MTWYTLLNQASALTSEQAWNGYTIRQVIPASTYNIGAPETGTAVRVTIKAGTSGAFNFTNLYLGHGAATGDPSDFDGTQVLVASSGSASAGGTLLQTSGAYAFDKTKPLVVSMEGVFPANLASSPITGGGSNAPPFKFQFSFSASSATDITVEGTYTDAIVGLALVEVLFTDPAGNPTCTIVKLASQADPTAGNTIVFDVRFNKGVTGFTSADCNLSSSTVTWLGGAPVVVVTGSDFRFLVTVSGMLTIGNVTLSIAASVCTAVSDGLPNAAGTAASVAWDPDIIDPLGGPNIYEITTVTRDTLRVEVRDKQVQFGYYQELTTPDSGTGTFAVTGAVDNGHGQIRLTTAFTGAASFNMYIQAMAASPVSDGAGGFLIRCTVFDTSLMGTGTVSGFRVTHARGMTAANGNTWFKSAAQSGVVIDATHFDLVGSTYNAGTPYTGGGVVQWSVDNQKMRTVVHSVGGTVEANGSWLYCRSGSNTIDLIDSHFANTYTSGGRIIPLYTWVQRANPTLGGVLDYCQINGRLGKQLRFQDIGPTASQYLNRDAALVVGNYTFVGGPTITTIYHESKPFRSGDNATVSIDFRQPTVSFRHYLYLQLSGNLVSGNTYTILFPPLTGLPPKTFVFNDKVTRCCAIHADQNGHRPGDPGKLAYLSEWVPDHGTYGEVDYSAVTAWHLIDDSGAIAASFGAPVLRVTPTTMEGTSVADPSGTVEPFAQSTKMVRMSPAMKVISITNANPGVVTVDDASRIANGDTIAFADMTHWTAGQGVTGGTIGANASGHSGMWELETDYSGSPVYWGVTGKSGNTFSLALPPNRQLVVADGGAYNNWTNASTLTYTYHSSFGGGAPGPFTGEPFSHTTSADRGNLCYKINMTSNRASTNVYGLNYASFTTAGTYRIYIPNIGVSDPVYITESRWWRAFQLYSIATYHERAGLSFDGRFGFHKPLALRPRSDQPVWKSYLPYNMSEYNLEHEEIFGASISDCTSQVIGCGGGNSPWVSGTAPVQATAFGSHMDAGDFDQRISETCWYYWYILEIWEHIGAASRTSLVDVGLPTLLEAGLDPTTFAGTDGMPSPLNEVIWGIEQCRLSQEVSGAVSGGQNYGEGGPDFETSWSLTPALYTWFPDHAATFQYAFVAGKLARILSGLGYATLASTYQTSAIAAYDWASNILTNTTARDTYYATTKTIAQNTMKWDDTMWGHCMDQLQFIAGRDHAAAAASLLRLTGNSAYKTVCDAVYPPGALDVRVSFPAWEYAQASTADGAKKATIRGLWTDKALNSFIPQAEATDISYVDGLALSIWNMFFGGGNNWSFNMPVLSIASIIMTEDGGSTNLANAARCRKVMQQIAAHRQGANQIGLCHPNGLGVRHNMESLHLDSRYSGQDLPRGITSEGVSNLFFIAAGLFGDSYISRVAHQQYDPEMTTTDPLFFYREMYPYDQLAWPRWNLFMENYLAIEQSEYTTQQQLLPAMGATMYLHGFDNNAAVEAGLAVATAVIVSSVNPSTSGTLVTFTVTVTGASGTPTGTVTFTLAGVAGSPITLVGGVASTSSSALSVGSNIVSVSYSGDTVYDPDSDFLTQTVTGTTPPPTNQRYIAFNM